MNEEEIIDGILKHRESRYCEFTPYTSKAYTAMIQEREAKIKQLEEQVELLRNILIGGRHRNEHR